MPFEGAEDDLPQMTVAARTGDMVKSMRAGMAFHTALVGSTGLAELTAPHLRSPSAP